MAKQTISDPFTFEESQCKGYRIAYETKRAAETDVRAQESAHLPILIAELAPHGEPHLRAGI